MNRTVTKADRPLRSMLSSTVLLFAALALIGLGLAGCTECTNPDDPDTCQEIFAPFL